MTGHSCVSCAFPKVDSFLQVLSSPDIVGHIASFLNPNDKKSLRRVCKTAREALDAQVFSIRISFPDVGCTSGAGGSNKREGTRKREANEGPTETSCPPKTSLGQNWFGAQDVSIDGCRDNKQLLALLNGAAQRWPNLKYLWISDCHITNTVKSISDPLGAQRWDHLIALDITGCRMDSVALDKLCDLDSPSLRRLDLSENNLSSLKPLLKSRWTRLKSFIASENGTLDLLEAIAIVSSSLASVERLDLSGIKIRRHSYTGLPAEYCATWPQNLNKLKLRRCGLSDIDVKPLLSSLPLGLLQLDVEDNEFQTKESISGIASIPLPNLKLISLSRNTRLFSNALLGLENAQWPHLERFEASELYIDISGVRGLTKAKLPRVRTLVLRNCLMSWGAVDQLATGNWPCLEKLDIGGKEGIHLRRAGPSLASATAWNKLQILVVRPTNLTSMRAKTVDRWAIRCLLSRWEKLMVVME
jgi:hypothetical protein